MNGRVLVDLDELGQVLLRLLDVDVRVARVVEDAEEAVDADVDARRLEQRRVVRIDPDPPLVEQPRDGSVGKDHAAILWLLHFMALYDAVQDLPVEIDSYELERLEYVVSPEFTRVTTVVHLRGAGEEGVGEDVTYTATDHPPPDDLPLAGSFTLDSYSQLLDALDAVHRAAGDGGLARLPPLGLRERGARPRAPPDGSDARRRRRARAAAGHVRHFEAPRRPAVGRPDPRLARPVPEPPLQARPDERLDGRARRRPRRDRRDRLGRPQGPVRGHVGRPAAPTRCSTSESLDAFPDAWVEDPNVTDETRPILEPHAARITWDAPIHSVADIESRPWPPRTINIKPSRFGAVRAALRRVRLLRRARDQPLRRRPVGARPRARADPVPRVALPSGHAERRRSARLQRARAAARIARRARSPQNSLRRASVGPDNGLT